jgi:hypothetical protein
MTIPSHLSQPESNSVFIVGGGSSLLGFDWSRLDGKNVIAINRAYEVLPNADIVYFSDPAFWREHGSRVVTHSGRKIYGVHHTRWDIVPEVPDIEKVKIVRTNGLSKKNGEVCQWKTSLSGAINIAVQLKFKTIYLLGIDMQWDGNTHHWHSGYKEQMGMNLFDKMMKELKSIAGQLRGRGIKVINLNPESALRVWKKMNIDDVLE